MKNKLNFKIVGSGPTGLLLSIALSNFDCNVFLTDLLTKDRLIDKDKTYAITHSTRKILSKFKLWEKLSFPIENKHSQIRLGSSIRCLITSDNRNFDRDLYLTDAWLPEINLWVGEYPYLLRPAFEEICYIYLNR